MKEKDKCRILKQNRPQIIVMKAIIRYFVSFLMVIIMLGSFMGEVSAAAADNDAPLLTSIRILDGNIQAGEDIRIEIGVNESVSGLKKIALQLNHWPDDRIGLLAEQVWSTPLYSADNDSAVFTITVPTASTTADGKWFIGSVELYDAQGNYNRFYGNPETDIVMSEGFDHRGAKVVSPAPHAEISGSAAGAPSVLDKLVIRNKTVAKNETLKIDATVTCGDYVSLIQFDFVNDDANTTFYHVYEAELARKGTKTYKAEIPIGKSVRSGEWRIQHIYITDLSGSTTWYTSEGYDGVLVNGDTGEEVSRTPMFTVTGDDRDTSKPELISIRVLNEGQELQKPDTLEVGIEVLEEDSGITNLEFATQCISGLGADIKSSVFHRFSAKGYSYRDNPKKAYSSEKTEEFFEEPLKSGKYKFFIPIPETVKYGEYVVYLTELWDAEDNSSLCYSPQDTMTAQFSVRAELSQGFRAESTDEELLALIDRMEEDRAGTILFAADEKPILQKEALDRIVGENKTLICDVGAYQWVINGLDLQAEKTADIDLTAEIRETELKMLKDPQNVLQISLAEENEQIGSAQLRIKTDFVKDRYDLENELWLYDLGASAGESYIPRKESNLQVYADDAGYWCWLNIPISGEYFLAKEEVEMLTLDDIAGPDGSEYVYTGEAICPQPNITLGGRELVKDRDYTLTYRNNTEIGTAAMTLTCIGDYERLGSKETSFTILPEAPVIKKVRGGLRRIRIKWERTGSGDGYEVQLSPTAEMTSAETVAVKRRAAKTFRKLDPDTVYYVRIRAFKEVDNRTYYSEWTQICPIKTK